MKCSLLRQWHRLHFCLTAGLSQASRAAHRGADYPKITRENLGAWFYLIVSVLYMQNFIYIYRYIYIHTHTLFSPFPKLLSLQLMKVYLEIIILLPEVKVRRCVSARKVTTWTALKRWTQHFRGTSTVPTNSQTPKPEGTPNTSEDTGQVFTKTSFYKIWFLISPQ